MAILTVRNLLDSVNDATNAIAVRVQDFKNAVSNRVELTPEESAEAEAIISRLQAMGTDESNPVALPAEELEQQEGPVPADAEIPPRQPLEP